MNRPPQSSPFTGTIRFPVPLPIVIPFGALIFIAAVTIGMSRILLSVPKEVAVVIALAIAANILIACTVLAQRPNEAKLSWAEFIVAATFPLVIAIALALTLGTDTEAGEGSAGEVGATGEELEIGAENVAFNTDELELPADEEAALQFTNSDSSSVQHNIAIYEDDSASKELFKGQVIPGGQDVTYEIPPLPKGEYYFQCDVHPGMNGTVTVQ